MLSSYGLVKCIEVHTFVFFIFFKSQNSNVSAHVSDLRNTKYLLVHGLADGKFQFLEK